jgi:hypothetical protein
MAVGKFYWIFVQLKNSRPNVCSKSAIDHLHATTRPEFEIDCHTKQL